VATLWGFESLPGHHYSAFCSKSPIAKPHEAPLSTYNLVHKRCNSGCNMARFTARGKTVTAQIRLRGVQKTKTFQTKAQARVWAHQIETEILAGKYQNIPDVTVARLLERYGEEVTPTKRGKKWEANRLKQISRYPIGKIDLANLSSADITAYRDSRLREVSGSTVNRELTLLSHAFTVAGKEWKWIPENPCKGVRKPAENAARDRIITDHERDIICAQLGDDGVSGQVKKVFLFALETGMRAGEIVGLESVNVIKNTAYLPMTKNGKARTVPLSVEAQRLVKGAKGLAFGLNGSQLDSMFRKARDAAAEAYPPIAEIRFHDTRHTAATRWAEKLNLLELCAMFGFKPDIAARVYVNLDAKKIAEKLK
jgi:integrase